MATQWAIGIDMGGTFIDVVACSITGALHSLKHPRAAGELAAPVLCAVQRMLDERRIAPASVARIVHGSTVVTNLLLEQNAGPIAVLTTGGMRDVLALARQDRRDLYAAAVAPPTPERALFPAHLRFELCGRMDATGTEIAPLDDAQILEFAHMIAAQGVRSVAVCLLFAHLNPAHEERVQSLLLRAEPALTVSLSSEVDPKPREFERFLSTALDAYSKPMVAQYLQELATAFHARGLPTPFLMRSEGGIAPWQEVVRRPISLAMSGPCAALHGVTASLHAENSYNVIMAIDVGGTSTDIGMLEAGRPLYADTLLCGDLSLRLRCADVESVAIGGGSLATVNAGRGLRLGPRSQGAWPGPAAYGFGGSWATLTDALLVLGRLPQRLAGGVKLHPALSHAAVERDVAQPLGLSVADAATAVVRTAATAMAEAVKMRAFQRGLNPADCLLVAAGGGGAQHVAEVAELAGVTNVRVIAHAGVVAALGLLAVPPTKTVEKACALPLTADGLATLGQLLTTIIPEWPHITMRLSIEVCHPGQGSTIEVDWFPQQDGADALLHRFEARHEALRGHAMPDHPTEIRVLRAVFEQDTPVPGIQPVHLLAQASVWEGCARQGSGPLAIFGPMTTVWVPAGWQWEILEDDSLQLRRVSHLHGAPHV